ncbi:MAG: hypothetical protein E6394_02125 [Veillonella sp.]|nr:hypothetical protein [Veillonella sp.]
MNKSFWLFTLICSLFVSAITTVLSLSGALSLSILVFPVLSLVIPIMVRRLKNSKFNDDLPLSMGYHALYIDLQDPMVYFMYASSMNVNILFAELVLLLVSLLAFVFYLYPRDLAYKGVRLFRIIITAGIWLAMNAHILYGGYIPEFILSLVPTVFPTYQGNPLVFVTPTLLEAGMTGGAVIIGALVERGIISRRRERI